MNSFAPIVLFVYNRPRHTRQTLEALSKNLLADQSKLYIYADGPKENATEEQLQKIKEVRNLVREKKWCREVEIIEREKNMGVDNSIIAGVTALVNKYGKIIVLEDDLFTSHGFLKYMNEALNIYEFNENVMGISGYNFPSNRDLPETFFLYGGTNPWGWGTWKRAWDYFIPDSKMLYNKISNLDEKRIKQFNFDYTFDYLGMLKSSVSSNEKPYDIRWYSSVFLKGGLGLWPGKSLVQNIGHDGSGTHCDNANYYYNKMLPKEIIVTKIPIVESKKGRKEITRFYSKINKKNFLQKVKKTVKNFI